MKTYFAALVFFALPVVSTAHEPVPVQLAPAPSRFGAEQLDQLLGPIALYPDALIALILPAATAPADIVLAARYLENEGDPTNAAGRTWDESVKSLLYYAEVVKWMDANLDWTKQVGEAFSTQPTETMEAIQRLRAKARAAGTLVDSPQQQVLVDRDVIALVPTQPDVIYVPYYDPMVVYGPPPSYYGTSGFVTFSGPFAVGAWLTFDCDWRRRTVWTADRHWTARGPHDWRRPVFPDHPGYVHDPRRHPWQPAPNFSRPAPVTASVRVEIARPVPIYAAPPRPPPPRDDYANRRNAPAERPRLIPGRSAEGNYSRATAPVPAPTVQPASAVSVTTAAPAVSSSPSPTPATTTTPPANRRADPERGRNAYGDRSNRPPPPQTAPTATPAANVVGPAAPAPRNNPPVTGNLVGPSGPRNAPPAPPPQSNPPPAARAAPPPPAATPATPSAPASDDDRKRRGSDGDSRKQPN